MKSRALELVAIVLVTCLAMGYAFWATGYLHSALLNITALVVAPPSLLFLAYERLPLALFLVIFFVLQFAYLYGLLTLGRRWIRHRRSRKGNAARDANAG